MRLSHQLLAGSALVFLVVLAAVFGSHVGTSRAYLEKQLASHAQDAATSLAVALTASLRDNDMRLAETTINAVYARGYYRRIALLDLNGKPLIEKITGTTAQSSPPHWIRSLFPFETPRGTALVTVGWRQLGQIEVESSPEFAYRQLEDFSAIAALWLTAAYAMTLFLLSLLLRRVLDPLRRIETAVDDIARRHFRQISPLPGTRELRRVVEGINRLSATVERLLDDEALQAERFRTLAYTDAVVGLPNRAGLMVRLEARAEEIRAEAALVLVSIDGLQDFNSTHGYVDCDEMIAALARVIKEVAEDGFCARLQGGCFAVLSYCDEAAARALGDRLRSRLSDTIHALNAAGELDFAIGISSCPVGASPSELLAAADTALAAARHLRLGSVVIDWQTAMPDVASQAWQRRIQRALDEHRFVVAAQGVFLLSSEEGSTERTLLHKELFARLQLEDGDELSAGQFLPMAARHGQLEAIDRVCLQLLFAALGSEHEDLRFSFNLSAEALRRPLFTRWLLDHLAAVGTRARSLNFEVSDCAVQATADELGVFAEEARRLGVSLTIDQFGLSANGFRTLRTVLPDYVKLAGSLIQDVVEGSEKHFYLESVCRIAASLNIPVIATCVERPEQLPMLRNLGVHAVQGNALAPVQAMFGNNR